MPALGRDELTALDDRIDSHIGSFSVLRLRRPVVLLSLLRLYEDYLRLAIPKIVDPDDVDSFMAERKNAQDAMQFAIPWAVERTPDPDPVDPVSLDLNKVAYEQCMPMFEGAKQYSHIWDAMVLMFQGRCRGERSAVETVVVSYSDSLASEFDVAGRFIAAPDPPGFRDRITYEASVIPELLRKIEPRDAGGGKVAYDLLPDAFELAKAMHRKILGHLSELDGDWDLGGYTVAEYREVWLGLVTFCFVHQLACWHSGALGGAAKSLVPVKTVPRWEKDLVRWSGVCRAAVSQIITDLTFAAALYRRGEKRPDVSYQPFVPLSSKLLALSPSLVLDSNGERNLWDLVSIIRPRIHSGLRNHKERYWTSELVPWLENLGLRCVLGLPVSHRGKRTDLDLLVADPLRSFCLGFQLKWLTAPDRIRDVVYADRELIIGTDQAELSFQWLITKPDLLRQALGLTAAELAAMRFQVAVLSKNCLGSVGVYRHSPDIPVITERLLKWILGAPHRASLEAAWHIARTRSYFPIAGVHYADEDFESTFGAVTFFGKALSMRILRQWSPDTDITIASK